MKRTLLKVASMILLTSAIHAKDVYKDPNGGNFVCNVRWQPPAKGKTEWTCPGTVSKLSEVPTGVNVVGLVTSPNTAVGTRGKSISVPAQRQKTGSLQELKKQ